LEQQVLGLPTVIILEGRHQARREVRSSIVSPSQAVDGFECLETESQPW
jgi:hypothetical protein